MIVFSGKGGSQYRWDHDRMQLHMPDGQVHHIEITSEPGLCHIHRFVVDGKLCRVPAAFASQHDSSISRLQASIRNLNLNTSQLPFPAQDLWKRTLSKQLWLTCDISFVIACVYTMSGAMSSNVKYTKLLGELIVAYLIGSIQSSLLKGILHNIFEFQINSPIKIDTTRRQGGATDSFEDSSSEDDSPSPIIQQSSHRYQTRSRGSTGLVTPFPDEFNPAQMNDYIIAQVPEYTREFQRILYPGLAETVPFVPSNIALQDPLLKEILNMVHANRGMMQDILDRLHNIERGSTGQNTNQFLQAFSMYQSVLWPVLFGLCVFGVIGPPFLYRGQDGISSNEPGLVHNPVNMNSSTLSTLIFTPVNSTTSSLYAIELLLAFNSYSPFLLGLGPFSEELAWERLPHNQLQRFFRNLLGNPSLSIQSRINYTLFHIGTHAFGASLLLTVCRPYRMSVLANVGVSSVIFVFWMTFLLAMQYSESFEVARS